jgi:hypothetical protein
MAFRKTATLALFLLVLFSAMPDPAGPSLPHNTLDAGALPQCEVPNSRSPASPSPGTMYLFSSS